ncbi:unnamed protein product, partial [Haemonchus placei]|uniref:Transposase n=1 Tax=Haemonchus placei TaxID=6290 RepID=A0A0N4WVD3_HAEPC
LEKFVSAGKKKTDLIGVVFASATVNLRFYKTPIRFVQS